MDYFNFIFCMFDCFCTSVQCTSGRESKNKIYYINIYAFALPHNRHSCRCATPFMVDVVAVAAMAGGGATVHPPIFSYFYFFL